MIETLKLVHEPRVERRQHELRELGTLFFRRRREGLTVFAAIALVGLLIVALTPRTYTTTVKLIAGNPAGPSLQSQGEAASSLPVLNALLTASSAQNAQTYAALFQQVPIAQDVVNRLHLPVSAPALLSRVTVTPETDTSLLDLSVAWSDPQTSAHIANAFARAVMDRQRQLISAQANTALKFLSGELPKARASMQHATARLAEFQAAHKLVDVDSQTKDFLSQYDALDAKALETQLARRQAQAQIAALQQQLAAVPAQIPGSRAYAQDPGTSVLQTQLAQAESQLRDALERFTPKHPVVRGLQSQVSALKSQIASQKGEHLTATTLVPNPVHQQLDQELLAEQGIVASSNAALAGLSKQRAHFVPQFRALPAETAKYADLSRQAKSAQAVYDALQQKYDDATVAASTVISDVTVTQPASAMLAQMRPAVLLSLLLTLAAALICALAAMFAVDLVDRRANSAQEIARVLGLEVVADVPRVGPLASEESRSLAQSAFLRLASLIRFSAPNAKVVAITSPARQEGKSTIALNLGMALAEFGARTLVIDAGHIRYSDAARSYARGSTGFFDLLKDPERAAESAEPTRSAYLHVLAAGEPRPTMLQDLSGPSAQRLFEVLKSNFDYVVVDAPALSSGIAANVLLQRADATFMVLERGVSDLQQARGLMDDATAIGGGGFAGAVLNGAAAHRKEREWVALSARPACAP